MVSDLKTFVHKGCKIAAAKKSFLWIFFHLFTLFKRLFAPLPKVQFPNLLDFKNPWGKVMVRSPAAKTLGACGPTGFGLGTSLGTPFTMIPPRIFHRLSHCMFRGLGFRPVSHSAIPLAGVRKDETEDNVYSNKHYVLIDLVI